MFSNIFETVVKGSNVIFLDIPKEDYFYSYSILNKENAEHIAKEYFKINEKEGIPTIENIEFDPNIEKVKITVQVDKFGTEKGITKLF